jgi:hypothetical protein
LDEKLKAALDFSNYRQTLATQRRLLKEKLEAQLTYGFNSGIFKIDQNLLTFVDFFIKNGRTHSIPLIDTNGNPVMIDDLEKFKDEIFDRYFSATNEYIDSFEKLKKSRTNERLLDL